MEAVPTQTYAPAEGGDALQTLHARAISQVGCNPLWRPVVVPFAMCALTVRFYD